MNSRQATEPQRGNPKAAVVVRDVTPCGNRHPMHSRSLLQLLSTASPPHPGFAALADVLLKESVVCVGGRELRPTSVEFYYHAAGHPDPFVHCHPLQAKLGRWYFHRQGQSYRGGSYKGLDITFGSGTSFGGILIRSLQLPGGRMLDGPSLSVNELLTLSGHRSVSELDAAIDNRRICDPSSPLHLRLVAKEGTSPIYATRRIGLTVGSTRRAPLRAEYAARRYRYLCAPRELAKGRKLLVADLHQDGASITDIVKLTGLRENIVRRWVAT